ncbi:MAG: HAD family phosphatase [Isosphaeraceae bacterium]
MRLPVLMFDFGNVIGLIDYAPMFDRFARRLGVPAGELERVMLMRGAGELGREFELGRLGPEEFAARVLALAGFELPYDEFAAAWPDIFTLNEPVARLAGALKRRGHPLLLGSNTNVLHADFYRRRYDEALAPFDHFLFSYEIGAMKPDPAFFEACVRAVGVPAASCVFIDDALANVEGARLAGLQGVLYQDLPRLIADLRALGVEVPDAEG